MLSPPHNAHPHGSSGRRCHMTTIRQRLRELSREQAVRLDALTTVTIIRTLTPSFTRNTVAPVDLAGYRTVMSADGVGRTSLRCTRHRAISPWSALSVARVRGFRAPWTGTSWSIRSSGSPATAFAGPFDAQRFVERVPGGGTGARARHPAHALPRPGHLGCDRPISWRPRRDRPRQRRRTGDARTFASAGV